MYLWLGDLLCLVVIQYLWESECWTDFFWWLYNICEKVNIYVLEDSGPVIWHNLNCFTRIFFLEVLLGEGGGTLHPFKLTCPFWEHHTSFAKLYLYIYIIINNYVYNKGGGIWSRITIIELCFVLYCEMEQPCDDPHYARIITRLFHFTMEDLAKFYDCSILYRWGNCFLFSSLWNPLR